MTRTVKVFISSPSDVSEERDKARAIIARLQEHYAGRLKLLPVFWEDLPLNAGKPFQDGIESEISDDKLIDIDVAVFILWSRLGTPLGPTVTKKDGSNYLSGTEREFDLMLQAYIQSDRKRPKILVYIRDDKEFFDNLKGKPTNQCWEAIEQKRLLDNFVQEYFYDTDTKTNIRAFHEFDRPHTFSDRLRTHLRDLLDEFTNDSDRADNFWDVNEHGSPYRGLEVFEMEHAKIFRGRNHEICDIQQALRDQTKHGKAFLLLVGASGSGKSSLVRAGVIPTIMEYDLNEEVSQWRVAIMTPNQSSKELCYGLASTLCGKNAMPELVINSQSIEDLGRGLSKDPDLAYKLSLLNVIKRIENESSHKVKILLLIDQLEELFINPTIKKTDAEAFIRAIRTLSESGSVCIIATLRSDFYYKVHQFPDLMYLKEGSGQKDILPPERASLRDIILEPAKLAGLKFEENAKTKESLAEKILNDAMQNPAALPLVEYTLNELFKNRSKEGLLSLKQYELLGGIEGAIGKRAEEVYSALSDRSKLLAPRLFRSLASINNQGQFASRSISIKEIPKDDAINEVIDCYLESRMIITQKSNNDDDSILKIAHEALFRSWNRYNKWLNEAKLFIEIRQKLEFSMKRSMEMNNYSLENHFSENRDILADCKPLSGGSELFSDEAEFIFRSSLCSGLQMLEWSA